MHELLYSKYEYNSYDWHFTINKVEEVDQHRYYIACHVICYLIDYDVCGYLLQMHYMTRSVDKALCVMCTDEKTVMFLWGYEDKITMSSRRDMILAVYRTVIGEK